MTMNDNTNLTDASIRVQRPKVEYVIFDMDGLLIDSERIYTEVTNKILEPYGVEMTWDIKAGCMGKPELQAAQHLLSSFPGITLTMEDYLKQRNILQDLLWPTVQFLPGAQKLVTHLHRHNIPIVLATGSRKKNYELKTAHLSEVFEGCFKGRVVCGDDERIQNGRGKPCPDAFLLAAREVLGFSVGFGDLASSGNQDGGKSITDDEIEIRRKGLVFEDAIPGVHAAKRAGMNVVWVPDSNLVAVADSYKDDSRVEEGERWKPDEVLRSLEEFRPEDWGLPSYDQ